MLEFGGLLLQLEQRRLAAIVSVDVVGFSRLMERDESGTLAKLKGHRAELIDNLIDDYGGRIVKTTGDGLLLEFPSVVAAVECAVLMQQGMVVRTQDIPSDQAIRFRIGVHLGDVIVDGSDIFGDGVNIAARLQELAEPGSVCISDSVHVQTIGRIAARFVDRGEQKLKNITQRVRTWDLARENETRSRGVRRETGTIRPAVAVLPFVNMSNDPDQEYFVDGITEDLITALSYQRLFPVLARNSTFVYKARSIDVSQIGEQLGVGYVIEGSVRKAKSHVRINAQLIETKSGHHVWAERYDSDLNDIFSLQDEIVSKIATRVAPELTEFELLQTRSKPPQDMSVWDLYLRAQAEGNKATESGFTNAEALLQMAITREASFAPAHSLLANVFANQYFRGHGRRPSGEIIADLISSAQMAIELDSHEAIAHSMLGCGLAVKQDFNRAINQARKALALNPYAFWSHCSLAFSLFMAGDIARSLEEYEQTIRIGTNDPNLFHAATMIVWNNYLLGNYQAAADAIPAAELLAPDYIQIQAIAASTWAQLGVSETASAYLSRLTGAWPNLTIEKYRSRLLWKKPELIEYFLNGLRKAGLPE
jgi:adenylate cyclase